MWARVAVAAFLAATAAAKFNEASYPFFPGQETYHQTGYRVGMGWAASVQNASHAYLTYGPYWSPPQQVCTHARL